MSVFDNLTKRELLAALVMKPSGDSPEGLAKWALVLADALIEEARPEGRDVLVDTLEDSYGSEYNLIIPASGYSRKLGPKDYDEAVEIALSSGLSLPTAEEARLIESSGIDFFNADGWYWLHDGPSDLELAFAWDKNKPISDDAIFRVSKYAKLGCRFVRREYVEE